MSKQPPIPPATASYNYPHPSMADRGIHGNLLEVTVIGCTKLKDTEWISRQDPYVCVEYGSCRNRTRVCRDGGKNPTFQEKFVYSLIEGLRELNVIVWNNNTISHDDFIGSGKVQLAKALSQGFDDSSWPLQTKTGRHAGEVRLIMHYSRVNNAENSHPPSAPPYVTASVPQVSMYSQPPPPSSMSYPPAATGAYSVTSPYPSYPPHSDDYPPPPAPYPPASSGAYPIPSSYFSYPPYSGGYPSTPYPPQPSTYPPQPYPPSYPPQPYPPSYPPQPSTYPPQPSTYPPSYPPQPYGSLYPHGSAYPRGYPPSY